MVKQGYKFLYLIAVLVFLAGCEKFFPGRQAKNVSKVAPAVSEVKGTVIARVNNQPLTLEELNEEIENYNKYVPDNKPEEKIDTRDKKLNYLKNEMIRRTLLAQAGEDRGLDRKEEMVDLLKDVISEIDSLGNVVEDDLTDNTQISTPQSLSETNTLESFSEMKARAKRELKCDGITSEQREAYISGISELLYRGILPLNYYPYDKLKEFIPNIIWHRRELANNGREDAWRFYLGLPQTSNTFTISDYKPSLSREDKYYYSIEDFEKKTVFSIEGFLPFFNDGKEYVISQDFLIDANGGIGGSFIMGQYKVSKGQDEKGYYLSYYDIWDLVGFEDKDFNLAGIEGEEGVFGKPFEIYGRIYYDPETFEVLPDETAEEEISCE